MRKIYAATPVAISGSKLARTTRFIAFIMLLCLTGYNGWAAPNTVCVGQDITLTGAAGGTWVSANASIAKINAASGVVTGVNAGRAIIYYRLPTGVVLTNTITVLPLAKTEGAPRVCMGSAVTYVNKTPVSGNWSTSNGTVATVTDRGVVSGVTGGTAVIFYTSADGCIATNSITVIATAPVTGPTSICTGETATMNNAIAGGAWTTNAGALGSINNAGMLKGVAAGTVRVSYTLQSGCHSVLLVTVRPLIGSTALGLSNICQGETTQLINTTPYGGTWSSSNNTVATVNGNGAVTGLSSGSTSISFTSSTGCITVKSMSVTATAPITGVNTVCVGQTTQLSNAIPGGRWASGADAIAAVTISSTGLVRGTYQHYGMKIYYIWPSGCQSVTTVSVRPLSPITGIASGLCQNMSQQATNTTPGTGIWASSNNSIASVSPTGMVTGISSGVAILSYASAQACITTRTVTISSALPVTGPNAVCQGQTMTMATAAIGGYWTSNSGAVAAVSQSGVVKGVNSGVARISYITPAGCHTVASVTVHPLSITTGGGNACRNQTLRVANTTPYGGTWSSSNPSIASVNALGVVRTTSSTGPVVISFTAAASGCIATRNVFVNACSREAGEGEDDDASTLATLSEEATLQLFPNPNTGIFTLKGALGTLATPGADEQATVEVMNMLGQVIYRSNAAIQNGSVNEQIQMNTTLPTGSYMLNMRTAKGNKQFRFVVQR